VALYRTVLGRDADAQGLASWVAFLEAGGTRQQVAAGFWDSPEHRGLEVDQFYATYLHRAADPAGRAYWVDRLMAGTSEAEVANGFLTSEEYGLSHPTTVGYLFGLYGDVLGRAPDADGLDAWLRAAQGGLSPTALADGFLRSPAAPGKRRGWRPGCGRWRAANRGPKLPRRSWPPTSSSRGREGRPPGCGARMADQECGPEATAAV
jgi:hypothetical protein